MNVSPFYVWSQLLLGVAIVFTAPGAKQKWSRTCASHPFSIFPYFYSNLKIP
jgi:hypothetical protein